MAKQNTKPLGVKYMFYLIYYKDGNAYPVMKGNTDFLLLFDSSAKAQEYALRHLEHELIEIHNLSNQLGLV